MEKTTLEPAECFRWFSEIAQIPRCSHNEKAVADYLVAFAEQRGLAVVRDAANNVCIKKPASGGMEAAPGVILQGHMDMVCVKKDGSCHDFAKDPIRLVVDGDTLRADGTTLGADNGIALAYILALLDSDDIPHPALEAVITVEEETGMGGAVVFDAAVLSGRYFINLDSEEEGVFCVSCAGGGRSTVSLPIQTDAVKAAPDSAFFSITLGGLAGGHSGIEIHKERGNANRLMGRVLAHLCGKYDCRLAHIAGGSAMNVIPSDCTAFVRLGCDAKTLNEELAVLQATFKDELKAADGAGLRLAAAPADKVLAVFTKECTDKAVAALLLIPHGVMGMDLNITDQRLVETSSNLGVVAVENGLVVFTCLTRSSVGSKKDFVYDQIRTVAECIGAEIAAFGDYPAWAFSPESKLRGVFLETYRALFKKEAKVEGVHAGLECGLFFEKFHELGREVDFIALGPDITGAHTVNEAVSIRSVGNIWMLLKETLRALGKEKA